MKCPSNWRDSRVDKSLKMGGVRFRRVGKSGLFLLLPRLIGFFRALVVTNLIYRVLRGALVMPGAVGTAFARGILKLSTAFDSSS